MRRFTVLGFTVGFLALLLLMPMTAQPRLAKNEVRFQVRGGDNAGTYGGALDQALSRVSLVEIAGVQVLHLTLVHPRDDGSTASFSVNTEYDGSGEIDLTRKIAQVAVLPQGLARGKPEYFTVSTTLGEGTLIFDELDTEAGVAIGRFKLKHKGVKVEGQFWASLSTE